MSRRPRLCCDAGGYADRALELAGGGDMQHPARTFVGDKNSDTSGTLAQVVLPLDGILEDVEIQSILMNDDAARDAVTDLVVATGRGGVPGIYGNGGIPGLPPELAKSNDQRSMPGNGMQLPPK